MSRVLLIGSGDLPERDLSVVDFPRLRCWQFLRALLEADHEVAFVAACRGAEEGWQDARFEGHALRILRVTPELLDRADMPGRLFTESGAGVVVSAGPFGPARAAARIPQGPPVFIDLPGDPMAESQLRAAATGDSTHLEHAHRVLSAVLARGDAFSSISERQRAALLGQLALAGRFTSETVGWEPVHVIPVGIEPLWRQWAATSSPESRRSVRIVWPGAINTWADLETFYEATILAMERNPELEAVVTGGPIAGHEEHAWRRLERWVKTSPFAGRWRLTGWMDAVDAARAVCEARLGVSLDLPCLEAWLGSRTRLMYGLTLGLEWVVTPGCELAERLIALGLARGVPFRDPQAVCEAILAGIQPESQASNQALTAGPAGEEVLAAVRARVRGQVRERLLADLTGAVTTRPLIRWLEAPRSAPPGVDLLGGMSARVQALEQTLADIQHSPTWQVLNRLHRLLKR